MVVVVITPHGSPDLRGHLEVDNIIIKTGLPQGLISTSLFQETVTTVTTPLDNPDLRGPLEGDNIIIKTGAHQGGLKVKVKECKVKDRTR